MSKHQKVDLQRHKDKEFRFTGSEFPEINRKISKFVNGSKDKRPPDFHDVKKLVKKFGCELGWPEVKIHDEARKIFESTVKTLKKRRCLDDLENADYYVQVLFVSLQQC